MRRRRDGRARRCAPLRLRPRGCLVWRVSALLSSTPGKPANASATTRLDVMRALSKTPTALLALPDGGGGRRVRRASRRRRTEIARAQGGKEEGRRPRPPKPRRPSAKANAAAPAPSPRRREAPQPAAAQAAGEPKPAGNPRAMAVLPKPSPLAEEAQHVAPLRCGHRAGPRHRHLARRRQAPARGDRGCRRRPADRGPQPARRHHRARRPQARRLVSLPWRIWHGRRDSRLPRRQPRLARPRPARPSAPRRQLFLSNASPREVKAFFATAEPRTAVGHAALAAALMADKERTRPRCWRARPGPRSTCSGSRSRPSSPASAACSTRPTTSAASTACCSTTAAGRRAQRARRRHHAHHRAAAGGRAQDGGGAPCRVPARQELPAADRQAAQAQPRRLGPRRAEGAGAAPPEEGGGGLEDPARRARRPRQDRAARRLVGGAARQRLRGAAGSASPRPPTTSSASPGRSSVNAAKDAAFLAGWIALRHLKDTKLALGALRGAGRHRRRPAQPRARPVLARPHAGGAGRQGQGAGALPRGRRPTSTPSTASSPASRSIPARACC